MSIDYIRRFLLFAILIITQVLLLNNIQFSGYINPYIYILFIILLPFGTAGWAVMLLSFIIGLTMDIFSDTPGMHAFASTLMGYARSHVIRLSEPREGYDVTKIPSPTDMGWQWFITYATVLVTIHHIAYFYIEIFRLNEFWPVLFRAILSSIFTLLFICIALASFQGKRRTT